VGVDDVAGALEKAESLGGTKLVGPMEVPGGNIGLFTDPEGHVVGLWSGSMEGNGDSAGLHHPAYDFNDEAIVYGTSYWIKLVENKLAAA